MAVDETPSTGPCGIGDTVSARHSRAWNSRISQEGPPSRRELHPDWFLEEIEVERGHVHLHMVIPPKYAVSRVVETAKSVTSWQLKEKFPHVLRKVY